MESRRSAWVCERCAGSGVPLRVFLLPGEVGPPRCPEHGVRMVRQSNVRYVGSVTVRQGS